MWLSLGRKVVTADVTRHAVVDTSKAGLVKEEVSGV